MTLPSIARRPSMPVKFPDPELDFLSQDTCVLLAMCNFGEARGETFEAKMAQCCVVRNRVQKQPRFGVGYKGVILKPFQFSCFNHDDPNRGKLLDPRKELERENASLSVWNDCFQAAYNVYWSYIKDTTGGAVFYFSLPKTAPPKAWGKVEHTVTIGGLHFYKEVV